MYGIYFKGWDGMKEVVIDSGIPFYEIKNYFEKRAKPSDGKRFLGDRWAVSLEALEDPGYKNLKIPKTRLIFQGEADAVDTAVKRYRRAFLRGGA